MCDAFCWTLAKDEFVIRFVLVGSIAVTIEPSGKTRAWTHDTVEVARKQALVQTRYWEGHGYALTGDIRATEVDVHLPGLTMECLVVEGVGPILAAILETLTLRGEVLDA